MLVRSPSSPLFPYTTLFRSGNLVRGEIALVTQTPLAEDIAAAAPEALVAGREAEVHRAVRKARHRQRALAVLRRDRKSTRLNSSHVKISYAVFCLKKKKNCV